MKNIASFIVGLLCLYGSAQAANPLLRFSPNDPKPGDAIQLEYDLSGSAFKDAESIELIVLEYVEKTPELKEIAWKRNGNKLVGAYKASPHALAALVGLRSKTQWDNNAGEGYFIHFCDNNGKALTECKAAQAVLYRDWGGVMELNRTAAVSLAWLEEAIQADPSLKSKYFAAYANAIMAVRRGEPGKQEAIALAAQVEAEAKDETVLTALLRLYERTGESAKATKIKEQILAAAPKGAFARQQQRQAVGQIQDVAAREKALVQFAADFPPTDDEQKEAIENMWAALGDIYGNQKNWDKFESIARKVSPKVRASLYNNTAWELAEKSEDLERAKAWAIEAAETAKKEIDAPSAKKPAFWTERTWKESRQFVYAQNTDTYAFILDKLGDAKMAAAYQQEVVKVTKGNSVEMNERYAQYLDKSRSPELIGALEHFISEGKATPQMKEQLKRQWLLKHTEAEAAAKMAELEQKAKDKLKKELADKALRYAAADFNLKNMKGESVSLASLKGKVVVVDFWATWCGPCKASFPGMQMAVDKFKDRSDVAFVFVDTWETAADKLKNAMDFIQSKGYTFNVLMDDDNAMVSKYGVSGIPTKFVLDKEGQVRFKSVGFSGSAEGLADELSLMIEVAAGSM